jgi:hypothetical protein
VVDGVADDRADHAVPAAAELGTDDLDHLDTCLAQQGVGRSITRSRSRPAAAGIGGLPRRAAASTPCSYVLVERPALRLKRRLTDRGPRPAAVPQGRHATA